MTTTIYLVRHGTHSLVDRVLCGRSENVALAADGRQQAQRLADELSQLPIDAVQCSPQQRTRETAAPIALRLGLDAEITCAMDELDAGAWTGQPFEALARDPAWHAWNSRRLTARPPGGESMVELRDRVVAHLDRIRQDGIGSAVIVSHAEPIRAAVLHYSGLHLDDFARVAIDPGHFCILKMRTDAVHVEAVNRASVT